MHLLLKTLRICMVLVLLTFVVATVGSWAWALLVEPRLAETTTRIVAQPASAGGWFVLASWIGMLAACCVLAAAIVAMSLLVVGLLVQTAARARRTARRPVQDLARDLRHEALARTRA